MRNALAFIAALLLCASIHAEPLASTPCDQYSQAEAVFVGTLQNVTATDDSDVKLARFTVEESLKGDSRTTAEIRASRWLVSEEHAGQQWLVFASRLNGGLLMRYNSAPLRYRSVELHLIRAFLNGAPESHLQGAVRSWTGQRMEGVQVSVMPDRGIEPARTEAQGSFALPIPAGVYTLRALDRDRLSKERTISVALCEARSVDLQFPRETPLDEQLLALAIGVYDAVVNMIGVSAESK